MHLLNSKAYFYKKLNNINWKTNNDSQAYIPNLIGALIIPMCINLLFDFHDDKFKN